MRLENTLLAGDIHIRVTKQLYVDSDSYLFAVKNDFDNLLLSFIISERAETSPVESLDVLNAEKLPFADPSIFWIHSANSSISRVK